MTTWSPRSGPVSTEPDCTRPWRTARERTQALVVDAPAHANPGKPFTVTVYADDFNGKKKAVEGAQVRGDSVQTTDASGHASPY